MKTEKNYDSVPQFLALDLSSSWPEMATSGQARSRCCTPQCGVLALFFTLTTIVSLVLLVSLIFILRWRFWTPSRGGVVHTLEFGAVAATTCLVLPVLWAIRACVARNSRNRDCGGSRPVQAACVAVFGVALVCVIGIFFTVLIFPLHSVTVSRSIPDSTSMVVPDTGGSASGGSASGGSASGGGTTTRRKRIAVIGGGPSGCVAALGMNYQQDKYEFVLYEKEGQLGGECVRHGAVRAVPFGLRLLVVRRNNTNNTKTSFWLAHPDQCGKQNNASGGWRDERAPLASSMALSAFDRFPSRPPALPPPPFDSRSKPPK